MTQRVVRQLSMLAVFALMLASSSRSYGAVDMFLKITTPEGKELKVAIENDGTFKSPRLAAGKYSFSWSVNPPISSEGSRSGLPQTIVFTSSVQTAREMGTGMATGRRQYQPLIVRKRIDKGTPTLKTTLDPITIDEAGSIISGKVEFESAAGKIVHRQDFGQVLPTKKD